MDARIDRGAQYCVAMHLRLALCLGLGVMTARSRISALGDAACLDDWDRKFVNTAPGQYQCQPHGEDCSRGIATGDDAMRTKCVARNGCRYLEARCFCEQAVRGMGACVCGGGPPQRCETAP